MSRFELKPHMLLRLTALLAALLICTVMMAPAVTVTAAPLAEGRVDRLTWSLSNGTLSIHGKGEIPDYTERAPAPWHEYRDSILRLELDSGITAIGSMAFYDCTALTMVNLPRTVKTVGNMAFAGCETLTTVYLPKITALGEYAFSRCFALQNVTLPDTLTTIGGYAFYRCESLPYIHIPVSVISLGGSAFAYCSALLRADIEAPLTALPEWCFYGCERLQALTVPASMTGVGDSAFTRCDALTTVYHNGTDQVRDQFSNAVSKSLPNFTVSQVAPPVNTPPTITDKDVVTKGDTIQEITTEVKQEGDTIVRVEQTVTYPATNGVTKGEPDTFGSTVYITIGSQNSWDDLLDEIGEQINDKASFESIYGEQKPVRAEVTLKTDMPLTGEWLENLSGQNAVVSITTLDGSRFTIDGEAIVGYTFEKKYTLGYTLTPCNKLSKKEAGVVGNATCYWLSFHSAFNFPVTVEILLDSYAVHQYATLYEKVGNDVLQKLQSARIDQKGYVAFRLATINKTTRYLLAMNVPDTATGEVMAPNDRDNVEEFLPLSEQYTITDVRGWFGLTMKEFTRFVLIGGGIFLGAVILFVLFFIILSKRKAKIAAIRAEVLSAADAAEDVSLPHDKE